MKPQWPRMGKPSKDVKTAVATAVLSTAFNWLAGLWSGGPEEKVEQEITGNDEVVIMNDLEETQPLHWSAILAIGAAVGMVLLVLGWCVIRRCRSIRQIEAADFEMRPRCYARRDLSLATA